MPIRKYHTKWFKHMFSIGGNKSRLSLNDYFSHIQTLLLAASQLESNWRAATWKKKTVPIPGYCYWVTLFWEQLPLYYQGKLTTNYPVVQANFLCFFCDTYLIVLVLVGQCFFAILVFNRDQSICKWLWTDFHGY